jgi:hypothetical protein
MTVLPGAVAAEAAQERRPRGPAPAWLPRGWPAPWRQPALVAVAVWLLCIPGALWIPDAIDRSPFTLAGSASPLLVGMALASAGFLLAIRWPGEVTAAVGAGLFAGWVVLTLHTALHGTPYGFDGLSNDSARLSAQAERYTTTLRAVDGIVSSVPSEYPPLFPWLIARAAVWSGTPAWRLLGISETLLVSATIVASFLLWRRMLPGGVALAVTIAVFAAFYQPQKAYEVLALDVSLPWALAAFGGPPRGRLSWLASGLIGGLEVLTYEAYLVFAALGILALIARGLRTSGERLRQAGRAAAIALVALLVSSWYVLPYLRWIASHHQQTMIGRFQDPLLAANPFPFLSLTPLGVLCALGVVGLLWYRRSTWWATPLLALVLSDYAYRFLAQVWSLYSGNHLVAEYTLWAVQATLLAAGVLTVARAVPALLRRLSIASTRGLGALGVGALALLAGTSAWYAWMPGAPRAAGLLTNPALTGAYNQTSNAFMQPLPDGRYPRYAPAQRVKWFPIDPIIRDVQSVLGRRAAPVTLSWSEKLFAIEPWPGYIGVGADAAPGSEQWLSRFEALERLARVRSPRAFAAASAHTRFGPIDVFVLRYQRSGKSTYWTWQPLSYPGTLRFTPEQFSSGAFRLFRNLPLGTIVAVRLPDGNRG